MDAQTTVAVSIQGVIATLNALFHRASALGLRVDLQTHTTTVLGDMTQRQILVATVWAPCPSRKEE